MSVLVASDDGVRIITFNRPERKNALTVQMYRDAVSALDDAAKDDSVRVVLITGAGATFTSGNDVKDFMDTPPTGEDSPVFQFLLKVASFEKPVMVAVNGHAVGIGVTMLLHVDVVYLADNATLKMPFTALGVTAEGGSSFLLPRIAGHALASELLLFGEAFDAKTAYDVGLASRIVPAAELAAFALSRAKVLANKQPISAVRTTKQLMRKGTAERVHTVLHEEAVEFARHLLSDDAREAFMAFFEKRKPNFSRANG